MSCPSPARRRVLAGGAAALGAGLFQACATRRPDGLVTAAEPRRFARVRVSPQRVIRTVVGLRPFRPSVEMR